MQRPRDIGKVGIRQRFCLSGKLNVEEFALMKTHTTIGANILGGRTSGIVQIAEIIALSHHERWDGGGYPKGPREKIFGGREGYKHSADQYDALSVRPYKPAFDHLKAFNMCTKHGRTSAFHKGCRGCLFLLPRHYHCMEHK